MPDPDSLEVDMLDMVFSVVGVVLNVWFLRDSGIGPITWCIFPYILSGVLSWFAKVQPWSSVVLGAVVLMLIIDAGFFIETAGGAKTPFLIVLSILSTLKLIIVFPVGAVIGYLLHRALHSKVGRIINH